MTMGIDASRAFEKNKTGIENYSFYLIRSLRKPLERERVVLFVRKDAHIPFSLPERWEVRMITWPVLWTQGGFAWEMWRRPVDVLLVPAYTLPWLHPRQSVVVVHGVEYESVPEAYSRLSRLLLRIGTRLSCRWAKRIVAVSEATKRDMVSWYGLDEKKIQVVYEGVEDIRMEEGQDGEHNTEVVSGVASPYFLVLGRLETRKNVVRVIRAFDQFKKHTGAPHRLVLAGRPGYGYKYIKYVIAKSTYRTDIYELGYVREGEKWELLRNAEALMFVSLAEGFGLPIPEAQSVGTPVIASDIPIMREVAGDGAVFVDPTDVRKIREMMRALTGHEHNSPPQSSPQLKGGGIRKDHSTLPDRNAILRRGYENVRRFSWEKCAREVSEVLRGAG